jgi:hypothetical protein
MTDQPTPARPTSQLARLALPFPEKYVKQKQGASYVNHGIVQQRLIGTIGPPDQRIVQLVRGDYDAVVTSKGTENERTWPARTNVVVGVVLAVDYHIDGRVIHIEDVGTPEGYYMAAHDGERAKKAVSDAVKRCAKQVGVALNLWSKGSYFLTTMLERYAPIVDPERPNGPTRVVDTETGEILAIEEAAADTHDPDALDPDDVDAPDDDEEAAEPSPQPAARPVEDVAHPAVTSVPEDPGADAYPGDDPNRKGARDTRSVTLKALEQASLWRVSFDPTYTEEHHERLMRSAREAQEEQINGWLERTEIRVEAIKAADAAQAEPEPEPAHKSDPEDKTDEAAAEPSGEERGGFTKRQHEQLRGYGVDTKLRHDLSLVISRGRTHSSTALRGGERSRLVVIAKALTERECQIAYDGNKGTPRLTNTDGATIDPWTLKPLVEARS